MAPSFNWKSWLRGTFAPAATRPIRRPTPPRFRPVVEPLADRVVPTVTSAIDGVTLVVTSDDTGEAVTIASSGGNILVNGVAKALEGQVTRLRVDGNGGNDAINAAGLNTAFFEVNGITFNGGAGVDAVVGTAAGDIIFGGDDGDDLNGGAGNDLIQGEAGNDTLSGGTGNDRLFGGVDADTVREFRNADLTLTPAALDVNGAKEDDLDGFEAAELTGGASANALNASAVAIPVVLKGGGGNDTLRGGSAADGLNGEAGNDRLEGHGGDDVLVGGAGNDAYVGGTGSDAAFETVDEATDEVRITSAALIEGAVTTSTLNTVERVDVTGGVSGSTAFRVETTALDVRLTGGPNGSDTVVAGVPGNATLSDTLLDRTAAGDVVLAGIERAELTGTAANNSISSAAFSGKALLVGGAGNDTLQGGNGFDTLQGGLGNDRIVASRGLDQYRGEDGTDTLQAAVVVDAQVTDTSLFTQNDNTFAINAAATGFERAEITGSDRPNKLNAGGFSGAATLVGGLGNDQLTSSKGGGFLDGGAGNDLFVLNSGVLLQGGADTDTLRVLRDADFELDATVLVVTGAATEATLFANVEKAELTAGSSVARELDAADFAGQASLTGGGGSDTLTGGGGDDTLQGGNGNDQLFGGAGNDSLDGGAGNDALSGDTGADVLVGGTGNDVLNGGTENDTLTGGLGADVIVGGLGTNLLKEAFGTGTTTADLGDDTLVVVQNGVTTTDVFGGIQAASLQAANGPGLTVDAADATVPVTLTGGNGADSLIGGPLADSLKGGAGNDTIQGGAGADKLEGENGDDALFGFSIGDFTDGANDTLLGGAGSDSLAAADPGDVNDEGSGTGGILVRGTPGDDLIVVRRVVGPDGPEARVSINGVESAFVYRNGETIQVYAGAGDDVVVLDESAAITWSARFFGQDGDDILIGAGRGDYLDGGEGADALVGVGGDDSLRGGAGNDTLSAGAGADLVLGDAGDDSLDGGAGADVLVGGAGVDRYAAADGEADWLFIDGSDGSKATDGIDVVIG